MFVLIYFEYILHRSPHGHACPKGSWFWQRIENNTAQVTASNICNFICNTYGLDMYVKSMHVIQNIFLKIVFHMNEGNSTEPQYYHLFVFVST